jgi:transcription elongation GreA/GreB family factor
MDKNEFNDKIQALLTAETIDTAAVISALTEGLSVDTKTLVRAFTAWTEAIVKAQDFAAAVQATAFFAKNHDALKTIDINMMREVIRRSAKTTEEKLFIDSIGLNSAIATAIVSRLTTLLSLKAGLYVSSPSWGFGQIQSIDTFYGKIVIDFDSKKNHTMSLAVASQNLTVAADDHIMVQFSKDKDALLEKVDKHPKEIICMMLRSYGPLPIQRLQDRLIATGIVAASEWKNFWEKARRSLKDEKKVDIPTKRTEPLRLIEKEETFDAEWCAKFTKVRDIKAIYDKVIMLRDTKVEQTEVLKDAIKNRLNFALKGAKNADFPRYAQIACLLKQLELSTEDERKAQAEQMTFIDDEQNNLLASVRSLSARDATEFFAFLLETDADTYKPLLIQHIESFNSIALSALLSKCKDDADVGLQVRGLLTRSIQPQDSHNRLCTLIVWAIRNLGDYTAWQLPSWNELASLAIHIIEQRLTGEELKMRNTLQGFFDNKKWLEDTCKNITAFERQMMFERIQASTSWETTSQRNILIRMTRIDPALANLRRAVKAQQEIQHITSRRSLAAFKLDYEHLVSVEIPKNANDIATARSYGDLRENAEYQMAKDQQRLLIGRQEQMNRTLRLLQPTDFSDTATDVVRPGVTVTFAVAGETMTYTILGELDSDEALKIISCRARLATALIGKHVGETAEIPTENGNKLATVTAIALPNDAIKAWLADIPTA